LIGRTVHTTKVTYNYGSREQIVDVIMG